MSIQRLEQVGASVLGSTSTEASPLVEREFWFGESSKELEQT